MAFGDKKVSNLVAVGRVDNASAWIWFRAERPGRYALEIKGPGGVVQGRVEVEIPAGNQTDNTTTVMYPSGRTDAPLAPLTRYDVRVTATDGTVMVGSAAFETAPATHADTPALFNVGIVSCHQPFNSDGEVSPRNMRLLDALPAVFRQHDIKFLLGAGDQIYADSPGEFSLMNPHYVRSHWPQRGDMSTWSLEQIRAAYQERYRICWNQIPWLKLMNSSAGYGILDDHEVFDDWGSSARLETAAHRKIIEGARLAYMDYQGSRQLPWSATAASAPETLDYEFNYGTVATFTFDLRSERRVGPPAQVVSRAQISRFRDFLARNAAAHVILVVTTVPLVHLPEWLTGAGQTLFGTDVDFPDHWSAPQNRADRDEIMAVIEAHLNVHANPASVGRKQRLIVVGGDVHVGCAFVLRFAGAGGGRPLFYELSTSAVSNRLKKFDADISILGPQMFGLTSRIASGRVDVQLLPGNRANEGRNPIGGLNAGLIEFKRNGDETNVRLKLLGYGEDLRVREEFVSGWL